MTEKQAIKILKEEKSWESDDRKIDAFIMGIEALEEVLQYRAIGTVDEVAEMSNSYINYFHKARRFEAIGTIEEFKALKEKFENAKDDIRKLLSSEYGSSCQFCVHDENEDAMCCNIGGSGSWCCENARWKEH